MSRRRESAIETAHSAAARETIAAADLAGERWTAHLSDMFLDEKVSASAARLRDFGISTDPEAFGEDLIEMARIRVNPSGIPVRTFSGGLTHQNGWFSSAKARVLLHWEGIAAKNLILLHECRTETIRFLSEPMTFLLPAKEQYTPDLLIHHQNGQVEVVEVKSRQRSLWDEDYRRKLGTTAEICRRVGWSFSIVLGDEIFANREHEKNCRLFSDRRFTRVEPEQVSALHRLATVEPFMSYGELARAMKPDSMPKGKAVVQALLARRLVDIDLTAWINDATPVRIVDPKLIRGDGWRRDTPPPSSPGPIVSAPR